jgi:hypothetical protein
VTRSWKDVFVGGNGEAKGGCGSLTIIVTTATRREKAEKREKVTLEGVFGVVEGHRSIVDRFGFLY